MNKEQAFIELTKFTNCGIEEIKTANFHLKSTIDGENGSSVAIFILKFLEYYSDPLKASQIYGMFNEVIDFKPSNFIISFYEFIDSYLFGSRQFRIEWRYYSGGTSSKVTTKEDKWAEPVVVRDDENGDQDPNILLEAMTERFERYQLLSERIEQIQKEFLSAPPTK